MSPTQAEQPSIRISHGQLFTFVRTILGGSSGRPDDEHPLPPGPWDPVIRSAVERISLRSFSELNPQPLPPVFENSDRVALNPQPLPPRVAFMAAVAQTVIGRAEIIQDVADATSRPGEQQGIIIVGGYIGRFSDEFCGTGFKLRWPFPGPPPPWFSQELNGIDLVMMASQFDQAAKDAFSPDLSRSLANASARFLDAGLAKLK